MLKEFSSCLCLLKGKTGLEACRVEGRSHAHAIYVMVPPFGGHQQLQRAEHTLCRRPLHATAYPTKHKRMLL